MVSWCARSGPTPAFTAVVAWLQFFAESIAHIGVEADVVEDERGNLACSRAQKVGESPDVLAR